MDMNNLTNQPDFTNQFSPEDIQNNKVMAVLAYFGILFLVPLLAAKDSAYAKFHANQGLVLFIFAIASGVLTLVPFLGAFLAGIGSIISTILFILGVVNAANGNAKQLPLIGGITILK